MSDTYRVLIVDLLGLALGADGQPSADEIEAYVQQTGGQFHRGSARGVGALTPGIVHFFYCPSLSTEAELLDEAAVGYDAVIAAATIVPAGAQFPLGGVRIGAGTGNMRSTSWGGGTGDGGVAPLMNTPGINSRATAQAVFKAILRLRPDLDFDRLHELVVAGQFDTGRDLWKHPTRKLETHRLGVIGFGNIGRDVARLGRAFGMEVTVHARPRHRDWIEAEGFTYAATIKDAAQGSDILSVHVGLGALNAETGTYANAGIIGTEILSAMNDNALVVNFDRGEVVDTTALGAALGSGKVGHAVIDADIFVPPGGEPTGPLAPYLPLARTFPGRVLLLPHAVADTDHPSRLDGAKQAVDQILDVIHNRRASNLVGTCPDGFTNGGARGNAEILGPSSTDIAQLAGSGDLEALRAELARLQTFLGTVADASAEDMKAGVLAATRTATLLSKLALAGPFRG